MNYEVLVAPQAAADFRSLSKSWSAHRPESRADLPKQFDEALAFLATSPLAVPRWRFDDRYLAHRFLGTPYVVIYRIDEVEGRDYVVAAWSTRRGAPPAFP